MSKLRKFTNGEISQVLSLAADLYVSDEQGDWDADDCLRIAREFCCQERTYDRHNEGRRFYG